MLPEANRDGNEQKLARGCLQLVEVEVGLGKTIADHKVGGYGHKELSEVLLGCSPGNATFQVGDVGGYPCMEKTLEGLLIIVEFHWCY